MIQEMPIKGDVFEYTSGRWPTPTTAKVRVVVRWVDQDGDEIHYHHEGDPSHKVRTTSLRRFMEIVTKKID